jgi:hypothetical protein
MKRNPGKATPSPREAAEAATQSRCHKQNLIDQKIDKASRAPLRQRGGRVETARRKTRRLTAFVSPFLMKFGF